MKQRSTSGRINRSKGAALAAMALNQPRALANALAAALAAPTDVSAIRYVRYGRQSTVNEGETPLIPGGYRRHGLTRYSSDYLDGSIGQPDLDLISTTWNAHLRSKVFGGGVRESSYDGSEYEQYISTTPGEKAGAAGGTYYSFEYVGRYLSFGARSFNQLSIEVDELDGSGPAYVAPVVTWAQNNLQVMVDTLRPKKRRYTLRGGGDFWFAGFATEQNIVPTPYNFLAGKPTYAFIGDSYWQSQSFDLTGTNIGELFIRLVGGAAQVASVWGGTGYAASGGDGIPFDSETRLRLIIDSKPDVVVVCGGINDGWPTYTATGKSTPDAIRKVYQRLREELPAAILVFVTPFSPKESNWNNPDGVARQLRLGLIAEFERTPGPCIFLDGYLGGWRTSNGQTNLFDSGPWQTGDGWKGNPTGVGFGDTWTQEDATHLTPEGCIGLTQVMTRSYKAALSALLGNRQYGFELPLTYRTAQPGVAIDFSDLTDEKILWRRNRLSFTEQFSNPVWIKVNGGTGTAPVVTDNYSAAPDGTMTASRLQMSINGGTTTADISSILQVLSFTPRGTPVSQGIWLKTNDGTTRVIQWRDDNAQTVAKLITVTPVWQQFIQENILANTHDVNAIRLWLRGLQGTADSADLSIWGAQCVFAPTLGDYQKMTDIATEFMAAFPIHATYQDNLGLQPVFDKEQPIGMALDVRMGGARGLVERTVNGDFSGAVTNGVPAGWTSVGSATASVSGGVVKIGPLSNSGGLHQDIPVPANTWVEVRIQARKAGGSSSVQVWANGAAAYNNSRELINTAFQEYAYRLFSSTGVVRVYLQALIGSGILEVKSVSTRDLPGNHAVQPTVGDRPYQDAKVNRLLWSEMLSNSVWSKLSGLTVAENTDVGPNGMYLHTLTGVAATTTYLQQKDIPCLANSQGWVSCHIKAGTSPASMLSVYNNGITTALCRVVINWASGVPSVGPLGGTWTTAPVIEATSVPGVYRIQGQYPVGANTAVAALYYPSAANAAETSKVSGFQMAFNTTPFPKYQRVLIASEYDAVGFTKGARFNGSNSWMSVSGMNLSGTDKVAVAVSHRKDSDVTTGMLLEYTPDTAANNGSFGIRSPQSAAPAYGFAARGASATSGADAGKQTSGYPSPNTAVLGVAFDLAQADYLTQIQPQINGTTPTFSAMGLNSTGGGNFANSTLFIGRRNGNSFPFNGVINRIGIRGGANSTLTLLSRWANEPVKVMV